MKTSCILFLSIFFVSLAFSGGEVTQKVSQIRISVPDKETLSRIWSSGIDYEGVEGKIGGWMYFVAGETEKVGLTDAGISYEVVIDDLADYYEKRLQGQPSPFLGFGYGSMGGFYTNSEVIAQLDSMRLHYPDLITARDSIGTTQQSRALWAVKISDNPDVNEPEEPEVLYTALHHAREPEGMMAVVYYMWWLLEHYGTDAEATYLVNNRQMWFIPVVNPDGYFYNQQTNPNGGGLWRKNRRNNGGGSFGVDLNRNYGPEFMWNANNGGSSTNPNDETYRGPAPFSEPETQAIDGFMRSHNIKTALNYHTSGNLMIYPWGYLSQENGDSLIFRDWAYDCTAANHYVMGTDLETVSYSTRGNSDDYMFGDLTKPVTFAMTPEVGTTGFWPTQPEILPLAAENLEANKWFCYFAGHYPVIRHTGVEDDGGNGFIDRGEHFALVLSLRNKGLQSAENLTIAASSSSSFISFTTSSVLLAAFLPQTDMDVQFDASVAASSPTGVPVQFYITFSDPDGFVKMDTLDMYIGTPAVVFADSASNGTGNWTTGQGWGVTTNAHSAPNAFTDSPSGNYHSNANNSLTLVNQLSLTGYDYAQLKFWAKWSIEPTWDFATVEVSTNNGGSWITVRTTTSTHGSGRSGGQQLSTSWGYDSYTPGLTWLEEEADLTPYVNQQVKVRFRVAADGYAERDGFYVDDIRLHAYVTDNNVMTCEDLSSFVTRCIGGGTKIIQARVRATGDWTGSTVTIDIDGTSYVSGPAQVKTGGSASQWKIQVSGVSTGTHTVTLIDPVGCYSPVIVDCGAESLTDDDWDDDTSWMATNLDATIPQTTQLLGNYPNPFNPSTTFRYELSSPGQVTLKIYNMIGQLVRALVNDFQSEGYHESVWDGRNESGATVASGIYVYRLMAGNFVETRKMLVLR